MEEVKPYIHKLWATLRCVAFKCDIRFISTNNKKKMKKKQSKKLLKIIIAIMKYIKVLGITHKTIKANSMMKIQPQPQFKKKTNLTKFDLV